MSNWTTKQATLNRLLSNDRVTGYEATFSVLVNNHPGVLQRVAGLFSRRGFNINSITVGQ